MQNYSLQILHEGGYNRILANKIIDKFSLRLQNHLAQSDPCKGGICSVGNAIPQEIILNETNYYTYGFEEDEASGAKAQMTNLELESFVSSVKDKGRCKFYF